MNEGFVCTCPRGLSLQADYKTCKEEYNENLEHKVEENSQSHREKDGCSETSCSHLCEEIENKAICSCPKGLKLSEDELTCDDIDECNNDEEICGNLECLNTYGSFKCVCNNMEEDLSKCADLNLCKNNGECSQLSQPLSFCVLLKFYLFF